MGKKRYLNYWRYHKRKEMKLFNRVYRDYWENWARENLESIERQVWGYRPPNKTV